MLPNLFFVPFFNLLLSLRELLLLWHYSFPSSVRMDGNSRPGLETKYLLNLTNPLQLGAVNNVNVGFT